MARKLFPSVPDKTVRHLVKSDVQNALSQPSVVKRSFVVCCSSCRIQSWEDRSRLTSVAVLFFLQFGFMTKFKSCTSEFLRKASVATGRDFALMCWKAEILPIIPRYGRGRGEKTLHAKAKTCAASGDRDSFVRIVISLHRRLPSISACKRWEKIIASNDGLRTKSIGMEYGGENWKRSFRTKSFLEALHSCGLVNWTEAEQACIPDSPGASRYWANTGLERSLVAKQWVQFRRQFSSLAVEWTDNNERERRATVSRSLLPADCEEWLQFWSCVQLRILSQYVLETRGEGATVPYHLRTNTETLESIVFRKKCNRALPDLKSSLSKRAKVRGVQ